VEYASIWRRLGAYTIDIIMILIPVLMVFILFFGFGDTFNQRNQSTDARIDFLVERNRIRDLSFLIWVIYGAVLEGSSLQATFGKKALGIRVVDNEGRRISIRRSIARNLLKIVSLLPLGLGFIWAVFSKERKTWHDSIAKTRVTML